MLFYWETKWTCYSTENPNEVISPTGSLVKKHQQLIISFSGRIPKQMWEYWNHLQKKSRGVLKMNVMILSLEESSKNMHKETHPVIFVMIFCVNSRRFIHLHFRSTAQQWWINVINFSLIQNYYSNTSWIGHRYLHLQPTVSSIHW